MYNCKFYNFQIRILRINNTLYTWLFSRHFEGLIEVDYYDKNGTAVYNAAVCLYDSESEESEERQNFIRFSNTVCQKLFGVSAKGFKAAEDVYSKDSNR